MPSYSSPSTCSTACDRKPHERIACSTPWRPSQSSMNVRNDRPASGMTGFGTESVSGRSRVPSPPARTSARKSGGPRDGLGPARATDPLERVAERAEQLGVQEVAPVDHERPRHPLLDLAAPVELAELRPLG